MTDPILYRRDFYTSPQTFARIEVIFTDTVLSGRTFKAVDLSVASAVFGDLNMAEDYANAILDAVQIAREKRAEVGLSNSGKPQIGEAHVIPIPVQQKKANPSRIGVRVLRELMKSDAHLMYESRTRRGKKTERVTLIGVSFLAKNIHTATFHNLREGKFIQRVSKGVRGVSTAWVISTAGRNYIAQLPEEQPDAL